MNIVPPWFWNKIWSSLNMEYIVDWDILSNRQKPIQYFFFTFMLLFISWFNEDILGFLADLE